MISLNLTKGIHKYIALPCAFILIWVLESVDTPRGYYLVAPIIVIGFVNLYFSTRIKPKLELSRYEILASKLIIFCMISFTAIALISALGYRQ